MRCGRQPSVQGTTHGVRALSLVTWFPFPEPLAMPIALSHTAPTLLIRRVAFERVNLTRQMLDEALGLTDEEFVLEGGLIAVGPLVGESALTELIEALERSGLVYFEDFFELSGNWPDWLGLFAMTAV